ncbi:hypothetical protein ACFYYR_16550 [Streptomyces sp. NPDC001922]|uniref:hypothetical protein n=1 Tax=Streptomyces sp. NPDC001922 TaxID=3364624 RepID=UPI0036BC49DE
MIKLRTDQSGARLGGVILNRALKTGVLTALISTLTAGSAVAAPAASTHKNETARVAPAGFFKPGPNTIVTHSSVTEKGASDAGIPDVSTREGGYTVKKSGASYELCGLDKIGKTSGAGKTTLVLTISKSVSAEWSASVGVEAEVVSAELGYKVTNSYTVEDQTRFEVPKGKFGTVEAFPVYTAQDFTVYKDGKKHGSGRAMKPTGVCWNQWTE